MSCTRMEIVGIKMAGDIHTNWLIIFLCRALLYRNDDIPSLYKLLRVSYIPFLHGTGGIKLCKKKNSY